MSFSKREYSVLMKIIENNNYTTSEELSLAFDVSVRTIKSDIKAINQILSAIIEKTQIVSRPRLGYLFKSDAENVIERIKDSLPQDFYKVEMPKDNKERIYFLIRKLLVVDYHIKIDEFIDELYISRNSLSVLLKEVRGKLLKYHLKLVSRPQYGLIIEGNESDRRLAVSEYFYHNLSQASDQILSSPMFISEESKAEYKEIYEWIKSICRKYKIDMSNYNMSNLVIHVIIGVRRAMLYNYNIVSDIEKVSDLDSIEFKAATEIIQFLEARYQLYLPYGETIYYANHIQTKRIMHENALSIVEINQLNMCIDEIINEINNNFGFDFQLRGELYYHLFFHLPQMINRLKKNMIARNPLVYDNIRRYLFASKVTHSACEIISRYYHVDVEINEFGYLLLYFNMAILNFETSKPLRIAILSGRGRPEALMYLNEIRETFSSKKFRLFEISDLDEKTEYDLLVTTYHINESMSKSVFVIENDDYLRELKDKVNALRYQSFDINKYLKIDYFTNILPGETKEEVMRNVFKELVFKNVLKSNDPKKFKMMDSELGNGVIHLQDTMRQIKVGMLYVALLEKPVYWENSTARIVVITKTKKSDDKDLYSFCRVVSKWSSNKQKINNLLKERNFNVLYNDILSEIGG